MKQRILRIITAAVLLFPSMMTGFLMFDAAVANADPAYNPDYLISDSIFSDTSTMSVNDIQNFLNNEGSGLKSYSAVENCSAIKTPDPYSATYYPHCGASVSAATIIYDAGHAYGINPRSIIATLQKEQSLITTPNPTASQINCAMGYNSCSGFTGFFSQVDNGTWQFRTYIELMNGRNWWGYTPASYPCSGATSLYSTGLYPGRTVTFANPGGSARTVTLETSATAALDCYTPYVGPFSQTGYSGSYNFVVYFELWFGSVASPCYNDTNLSSTSSGGRVIGYQSSGSSPSDLAFTQLNNTGSACAEVHVWNQGYQSWAAHIATGMKAVNPASGTLVTNNAAGNFVNGLANPAFILYSGSGGAVEVHMFSRDLRTFPGYYDVATNLTGVSATTGQFVAGDFFGHHYDQIAYVLYNGSSGHVEVHMFDPTLRRAIGYYDVATNLGSVSAASGTFVAGDFFGRGYDQLAYVLYNGSSGHVEVHVFDPTLQKAVGYYDVATDLSGVTATSGTFVAGDFLGRGYDQLEYVLYSGSSGRVETHLFSQDLRRAIGVQDIATNLAGFNPTQ